MPIAADNSDPQPPSVDRARLVGTSLPGGEYTIEAEAHRRWVAAVFADGWQSDIAHPMYLHLVAHCGMGLPIADFFELIGTTIDGGVMFGEGRLEFIRPLRIGARYRVLARIAAVERKSGGTLGTFDALTCRIDVADAEGVAGVSYETYVVPVGDGR